MTHPRIGDRNPQCSDSNPRTGPAQCADWLRQATPEFVRAAPGSCRWGGVGGSGRRGCVLSGAEGQGRSASPAHRDKGERSAEVRAAISGICVPFHSTATPWAKFLGWSTSAQRGDGVSQHPQRDHGEQRGQQPRRDLLQRQRAPVGQAVARVAQGAGRQAPKDSGSASCAPCRTHAHNAALSLPPTRRAKTASMSANSGRLSGPLTTPFIISAFRAMCSSTMPTRAKAGSKSEGSWRNSSTTAGRPPWPDGRTESTPIVDTEPGASPVRNSGA